MKNLKYISLCVVFFLITGNVMFSQNYDNNFLFTTKQNVINSNFQFDPTFLVSVGYGKILNIKDKKILINAGFSVPIFLIKKFDNTVLNLDVNTFLLKNNWNIKAKLGVKYDFFNNTLSKGQNIATYFSVMPGYYTEKWFGGIEIFYRQNLVTKFNHLDMYTQNFEDVTDGWLKNRAGFFYFSAKGSYMFNDKLEISLRFSYKIPKTLNNYPPFSIPYCGGIGINYYFNN